jgi:MoxR-like ATPase
MTFDVKAIGAMVEQHSGFVQDLMQALEQVIVGQRYMLERLLVGLLANGHVLLEGVPGLAKTRAVMTLAQALQADYQRIQFTPDLLPADLIGTLIYQPQSGTFKVRKGPVFANLVLADEINRAPAKVQSALLEAMQEGQVTIGDESFPLPQPFLVLATQNPIEQEGTYPARGAGDRFMLKLKVPIRAALRSYKFWNAWPIPSRSSRSKLWCVPRIFYRHGASWMPSIWMIRLQRHCDIAHAYTRAPGLSARPGWYIEYGAPCATISLALAAKAYAFLKGRGT